MDKIIKGKSYVFGKNIDTDQICPGQYLELTDHKAIASHCLEGARSEFAKEFVKGGIVIALENFGCGSSHEHAAISLKTIGVGAIIAKSFGRIFYRNAINMGIPLIVADNVEAIMGDGHLMEINLENSTIKNTNTGQIISCEVISEYAMNILEHGGIINLIKSM